MKTRDPDAKQSANTVNITVKPHGRTSTEVISRLKSTHLHLAHWEAILPQFVALAPANSSVQILQVPGILIGRTIRILQVS